MSKVEIKAADVAATLMGSHKLNKSVIDLQLQECRIRVRSNSTALLTTLGEYFHHVVVTPEGEAAMEVTAIDSEPPELGQSYRDWQREPGKAGRKDAIIDLADGRLVQKVRTGMQFLQADPWRIAVGAVNQYPNQVINFINAQYMNWLQHRQWLICHASGLEHLGNGIAIAGFSGGGKSTLMLQLLESDSARYMTNDRLFLKRDGDQVRMCGIPKLPRINPGTIVGNPRLHPLLDEGYRDELQRLPKEELWDLEEKYDVDISATYGEGRIIDDSILATVILLAWGRDSKEPTQVERVDINQRQELLQAIMKSPGPFYHHLNGTFWHDNEQIDSDIYLKMLDGIEVYEVKGGIDFSVVSQFLNQQAH